LLRGLFLIKFEIFREMESFTTQVDKGHYHRAKYDDLERFISYYYQIDLTRRLKPASILEVGIGNRLVSDYFKRAGFNIKTCDIDESLSPDFAGDIRKLPFDDTSFDVIMACEVLEHIPFEDFRVALAELARVSRRFVVISLPYRHTSFQAAFKFPFARSLMKNKSFFDFCIRIPLGFIGFENSGQHYWEIDRRKYRIGKVKSILKENFEIKKEVRPVLDSYHEFFVLEKKA